MYVRTLFNNGSYVRTRQINLHTLVANKSTNNLKPTITIGLYILYVAIRYVINIFMK